jgi:hypothetical protein
MTKLVKARLEPVKIYMNAERYRIAYLVMRAEGDKDPTLQATIASPHMVISVFAIELYLKCLLCLEGQKVPPTHNLKALFRDLKPATKARIEQLWSAYAPRLEPLWQSVEQVTGNAVPRDFLSLLDKSSQAFTELRYLHEDESGSFYVGDLVPMLRTVILERQPLWVTLRHTPPTSLPRGIRVQHANTVATPGGGNR